MTTMRKASRGFTLIELMIVIAVIGILASIAVSAYQTYTVRAQVAEALNMAAGAKTPVVDAFNNSGSPPADRATAGMSAPATDTQGKYVSSVDIDDGRVDITFGNDAHQDIQNGVVSFTPYMSGSGSIIWRCAFAPAPAGTVLLSGGGITSAYLASTIEPRYLPSSCRN
jgi:type IV pilus assembly protein PilA